MSWLRSLMALIVEDEVAGLDLLRTFGLRLGEPAGLLEDPAADAADAVAYARALAQLGRAGEAEQVLGAALERCLPPAGRWGLGTWAYALGGSRVAGAH